ncbi:hypothetical protein ACTJJ0_21805 [Chitinophaga sp. 22321]|uniref:DoxX family protein n=1 Tax=Chitinophaga hostae TaxID=2831022 RepID=A0ABS5J4I0_9BACT|nr:hypothetical protein [Chitinophaga hostae]MBS0030124.1 hypothetical protein [Chitinophaga hostae]
MSFPSDTPVIWMGKLLIKRDYHIEYWPGGSGDTTYNYLQVCCLIVWSLFITIIWSLTDRNRKSYDRLCYWTMVIFRYGLAVTLIGYGMAKVVKTQFPFPSLARLDQTIGDMSPMGLAWTYMGYSTGYNLFTGFAECFCGVLLFFQRTRLLGALMSITVTLNIVMMNLYYDIPVKLFSAHLLLLSCFIAWPDLQRLINFFVLNKPVPAASHWRPVFKTKWKRIIFVGLKYAFLAFYLYTTITGGIEMDRMYVRKTTPPLYGIYEVKSVTCDTAGFSNSLINNFKFWQKVYFDKDYQMVARKKDDMQYYDMKIDSTKHLLTYWSSQTDSVMMHYSIPSTDTLYLNGKINGDSIHVVLKRKDPNDFALMSRGFHWINEYPYNR